MKRSIVYIIAFLFFSISLAAQNVFKEGYTSYQQELVNQIKTAGQARYPSIFSNNNLRIVVLPEYQFQYTGNEPISQLIIKSYLHIDSSFCFAVIFDGNKPVARATKTGVMRFSVMPITEDDLSDKNQLYPFGIIKMLQKTGDNSHPFFIDLLPGERKQRSVIAFTKNDEVRFIDTALRIYADLKQLLEAKYGSAETFMASARMARDLKLLQDSLDGPSISEKIDHYKKFMQQDYYIYHTLVRQSDTAMTTHLLMEELKRIIPVTERQSSELRNKITASAVQQTSPGSGKQRVPFYGKNIYAALSSVLTEEQLHLYLSKRRVHQQMSTKAQDFVLYYMARQKGGYVDDALKDSLAKELFTR